MRALAERHAAVHAARRLHAHGAPHRAPRVDLLPVAQPALRAAVQRRLATVLHEPSAHSVNLITLRAAGQQTLKKQKNIYRDFKCYSSVIF